MTRAKIAISMPKELLSRVKAAVRRGEAGSVSAYVCEALEQKTNDEDVMRMLDEALDETGGPLTPEEIRWADGVLGLTKRHPLPASLRDPKPRRPRKKK